MAKYEIHWKDFNSPLFRNEIWVNFCYLWPKLFKLPFTAFGIYSEKNNIAYFADMEAARRSQAALAKQIQNDPDNIFSLINLAEEYGREINKFTGLIHQANLKIWSTSKMVAAYKKFAALQSRLYAIGVISPAIDVTFGPLSLESFIKSILGRKLSGADFDMAFSAFTAPTRDSFSREQEYELLEIYKECLKSPKIIKILKNNNTQEVLDFLQKAETSIFKKFERHAKKWAWVYYVFAGPAWPEKDFVAIVQDWVRRAVRPDDLVKQWSEERRKIVQEQKKYLKIIRPSQKEKKILKLGGLIVWAKPRRKDYQSKSYWHMEKWFREVAGRLGISLREARSMPQKIIFRSLNTGHVDPYEIQRFYECHLIVSSKRGYVIMIGDKARRFMKQVYEEKVKVHGRVFQGSPACPGKATGIVRVVNSPEEMAKMKEGDILVSVATSPSIVPAMRQAAAILTDEGGLTCHAAIVSRELKIPCVVGLKFITKAVKDGDKVEVDAAKGIVRRL